MNVELEDLCLDLDDASWVLKDVTVTVEAEGDLPEQKYEGKLIVSRVPINQN